MTVCACVVMHLRVSGKHACKCASPDKPAACAPRSVPLLLPHPLYLHLQDLKRELGPCVEGLCRLRETYADDR